MSSLQSVGFCSGLRERSCKSGRSYAAGSAVDHGAIHIRVGLPKSRKRAARIQHMKINDAVVVAFLQRTWQDLRPSEPLFPGSPGVFRRRWDKLLQLLGVGRFVKLTPASMRAEGAISAFRKGATVPDLLWRMRFRSTATLEFHLQEMTAISLLPSLKTEIRRRIRAAACFAAGLLEGPAGS